MNILEVYSACSKVKDEPTEEMPSEEASSSKHHTTESARSTEPVAASSFFPEILKPTDMTFPFDRRSHASDDFDIFYRNCQCTEMGVAYATSSAICP